MDPDASASLGTLFHRHSSHKQLTTKSRKNSEKRDYQKETTKPPMFGSGGDTKKDRWLEHDHALSAPHGQSINDGISKEEFTLRYSRLDDAIRLINLAGGKGALLARVDLKSAFRLIPVRREDRELLGIHWRDKFYVDRCLPFGLRSAPFLFNKFAQALEWILHNNHSDSTLLG